MLYIVTPVPFLHGMAAGNDSLWPSGTILSHEFLVIIAFGSLSSSTGDDFWSVRPSFKKYVSDWQRYEIFISLNLTVCY